jgi:hypothetical protein
MEADHATARAVGGAVIVPCAYLTVDCSVGCVKDQSSSVGILDSCGAARTGASLIEKGPAARSRLSIGRRR